MTMANKNICIHKELCKIYQGETADDKNKLMVYKNVFCHRGYRGWKNCNEYLNFDNTSNKSVNNENLK